MRRPTELWRRICSGIEALTRPYDDGEGSDERAPDVLAARVYESPRFRLRYPGNWRAEAEEEHEGCSIQSPGHSLLQVSIFEPTVAADEALEAHAEAFSDTLTRGFSRDEVRGWGALTEARGLRLRGSLLAHVPGELRLFAAASESATAVIIEQIYDEDRRLVRPGFALIAASFELRAGRRR